MRSMLKAMAGIVLLAALGGIGRSQAQHVYTDMVLKGCYGFLNTSVDTEGPNAARKNRSTVGTLCFDGNGLILSTLSGDNQTGSCINTNGAAVCKMEAGTYAVTNIPGQGMGTLNITGGCQTHAFSVNSVDANGLAHGFQFSSIKRTKCSAGVPLVNGGTAYLQP
jgi:hypothetical protein